MRQQDILLLLLLPRSVQPITFVNCKQFKLPPAETLFPPKARVDSRPIRVIFYFFFYTESNWFDRREKCEL